MIDTVRINVDQIMVSPLAYLVSDGNKEVWVKKSEIIHLVKDEGKLISIVVTKKFATEKGLS